MIFTNLNEFTDEKLLKLHSVQELNSTNSIKMMILTCYRTSMNTVEEEHAILTDQQIVL